MGENKVGKCIRNYRRKINVSTRKLARLSGISQSYISQLENGNYTNPHPEVLVKLANVFEISPTELMFESGMVDKNPKLYEKALILRDVETVILNTDNEVVKFLMSNIKKYIEDVKE